ncbi:TPA: pyridoxal phosphate-dependent aminotransferase [Streptococcus pyogenes]|nr:pyridoxal phosphate-dependent aminotransferase [Streptococcus pyogenes]HEQ2307142.1 pyridoxal phosphate-dependent aminotransferase [Streptococcus pyogenes]HER3909488.1 pyridoxal phosphate-dependent aminotransferase [Streptococcus pyogenes]HER3935980.1 pyridoxal phosphate-dependent aminotransferase [Streptococcus pyogenes]
MPKLSKRVLEMKESVTLAAGARAKALKAQGRDVLNLTLGEPDFFTPKHIQDKAIESIQNGTASFYTNASGLPELKAAIATYLKNQYGYHLSPDQIVAGTGAKFILYAFFMAVLNPGDQVLIPTPYWASYSDQVKMAEGQPIFVQGLEENQFKVTVDQLERARTSKTKVVLINSPSNPTGMIYGAEELRAIGEWAVHNDILILADDIYGSLVYNGNQFVPISTLSEAIRRQTITVNGVAKSYAMTGWRVGFAAGEPEIISAMSKIIGQTTSNLTTVSQYAAIEAFCGSQSSLEEMRLAFEERLNITYPLLCQVPGFEVVKPQGAFYFFPNVKKAMEMTGFSDVTSFANAILEEVGLAVVSGAGFGAPENVRLSYATDIETLKEAVRRLHVFMESNEIN